METNSTEGDREGEHVLDRLPRKGPSGGAWLAQSVERVTLDLGVASSSPNSEVEIT